MTDLLRSQIQKVILYTTDDPPVPYTATIIGRTSSATNATTTELPSDGDASIHKNTDSGDVFLAYNDGGSILSVQLT